MSQCIRGLLNDFPGQSLAGRFYNTPAQLWPPEQPVILYDYDVGRGAGVPLLPGNVNPEQI